MPELLLQHGLDAAHACRWLRQACQDWDCEALAPDAELLISELTTNVILHAGTDCLLEAEFDGMCLYVVVGDELPGDVNAEDPTMNMERGRGLRISAPSPTTGASPRL